MSTFAKRRLLTCGAALVLCFPVVLYMAQNCWNCGVSYLKFGWDSRPFISISSSGILIYVLYVVTSLLGILFLWSKTQERSIFICAVILTIALSIYLIGLYTRSIGVLQNIQTSAIFPTTIVIELPASPVAERQIGRPVLSQAFKRGFLAAGGR